MDKKKNHNNLQKTLQWTTILAGPGRTWAKESTVWVCTIRQANINDSNIMAKLQCLIKARKVIVRPSVRSSVRSSEEVGLKA